jgi:hypothetical protein
VYLGDRWNSGDLNSSVPVWLPITLTSAGVAALSWYPSWGLDTTTGAITLPTYRRLSGNQSGRCLDVAAGAANGSATQIWDCTGGAGQGYTPTAASELRVLDNKCLQARGQGTTAGTVVEVWDCNGGNQQKWMLSADGTIVGVQSRLCLDVNGQATANGTRVQLWTCNGGANQKWTRG